MYNYVCFVFEAPLLSRVVAQTISECMDTCHSAKDTIEDTGRVWVFLLYGQKKNWSREDFKHGVGRHNAHFRFLIALNYLAATKTRYICTLNAEHGECIHQGPASTSRLYASGQIGRREESDVFTWLEGHLLDKGTMKEA